MEDPRRHLEGHVITPRRRKLEGVLTCSCRAGKTAPWGLPHAETGLLRSAPFFCNAMSHFWLPQAAARGRGTPGTGHHEENAIYLRRLMTSLNDSSHLLRGCAELYKLVVQLQPSGVGCYGAQLALRPPWLGCDWIGYGVSGWSELVRRIRGAQQL